MCNTAEKRLQNRIREAETSGTNKIESDEEDAQTNAKELEALDSKFDGPNATTGRSGRKVSARPVFMRQTLRKLTT